MSGDPDESIVPGRQEQVESCFPVHTPCSQAPVQATVQSPVFHCAEWQEPESMLKDWAAVNSRINFGSLLGTIELYQCIKLKGTKSNIVKTQIAIDIHSVSLKPIFH